MITKTLQSIAFGIIGLVVSVLSSVAILAFLALVSVFVLVAFIALAPFMWVAATVLGVMFPWAE